MSMTTRALKAWDDFWAAPPVGIAPWGGTSASGAMVSDTSALRVSTVWRCLNLIGGAFATTPLVLYRKRPTRGRDRATERPEYQVLRLRPSPGKSAYRYRKVAMNHLLTHGNHYAEKVYNGFGELVELHGLLPDRMRVRTDDDGDLLYLYRRRDGTEQRLRRDRIFHVPGLGFDGEVGYSPISLMRETLGSYSSARDFGASFFRNGARPAVVMTHPKTMTPGAVERLAGQMDRLRGSGNAGKTVLLEEGADFKELGIPPEDAQFMESQRFYGVSEIARWFGVPPHMVGDVDKSTSWGSGIEEQTIGFVTYTMLDWFVCWEQETSVQLLPGGQDDLYAEFLLDNLMRGKTLDRWNAYKIGRDIGALNPNDILERENMNPREDEGGDEYLLPLNVASVGDENERPQQPPEVEDV